MELDQSQELHRSVQAQARFRVRFGLLVAACIVGIHVFVPNGALGSASVLGTLVALYVIYTLSVLRISQRPGPLTLRDIVMITAVFDPLFLSGWLFMAGHSSLLFVGLYLFTILGFGFRVGAVPMHVCQAVSVAGFLTVAVLSPNWEGQYVFAASHVLLLILVPIYTSYLIRRIQAAKAEAERESRAKSQLLAKVSHELRTPLTGITAAAELLEVESRESATVGRARSILHLAGSLEAEITELLDMSRFEQQGVEELGPGEPFSLAYASTSVFKAMQSLAAHKPIHVEFSFDEQIQLSVIGNHQRLTSVLTNLVGNAVKFTDQGRVTLTVRLVEQSTTCYRVWFGVEDTGIGIAAEHLERIFEPFYQVSEGGDRRYGGTGLGTTIAKELVRAMGGELMVSSTEGEGSVFWFVLDLPLATEAEGEAGLETIPQASGSLSVVSGKHVLIADDNVTNLELLREMLLKDGHRVTAVTGGHEAIAHLSRTRFDLVLLDYNMGDISGEMVYQTYRFSRVDPAPTFFVTADTSPMTSQILEGLGANGVIFKPVTFSKLRQSFAQVFPDDVVVRPAPPDEPRRREGGLSAVPVEYLDSAAIEELLEIKDSPEFVCKIILDGIKDLEKLEAQLQSTLDAIDLPGLHRVAHAMKGVSLILGGVRLGALGDRLMQITHGQLESEQPRLKVEVARTTSETVHALEEERRKYLPPHAVND